MCTYYYNVVGVYYIFSDNQSSVTFGLFQGARGEFTATTNGNKQKNQQQQRKRITRSTPAKKRAHAAEHREKERER